MRAHAVCRQPGILMAGKRPTEPVPAALLTPRVDPWTPAGCWSGCTADAPCATPVQVLQDFLRDHQAAADLTHVNILAELFMGANRWAEAHSLILDQGAPHSSKLPIDLEVIPVPAARNAAFWSFDVVMHAWGPPCTACQGASQTAASCAVSCR